jgi:hypothetical protein
MRCRDSKAKPLQHEHVGYITATTDGNDWKLPKYVYQEGIFLPTASASALPLVYAACCCIWTSENWALTHTECRCVAISWPGARISAVPEVLNFRRHSPYLKKKTFSQFHHNWWHDIFTKNNKLRGLSPHARTIPTERPQLVGEVSANFSG